MITLSNNHLTFTKDREFATYGELFAFIYDEYFNGTESVNHLPIYYGVRIGEKVYHDGYEVNYPFSPFDFFTFEGTPTGARPHGHRYHSFYLFDFAEGGMGVAWFSGENEKGPIYYTHASSDALYAQQLEIDRRITHNPFSILRKHCPQFHMF